MIKKYILEHFRVKVSTLYIAQIKRKYGLKIGENYNKFKKNDIRIPVCPIEKEKMIVEALKYFQML